MKEGLPADLRVPRLALPRRFPPSINDLGLLWTLLGLLSKLSESTSLLGELPLGRLSSSLDVPLLLCCSDGDFLNLDIHDMV